MEEKCLGALNAFTRISRLRNWITFWEERGHGVNTISAECRWNSLQSEILLVNMFRSKRNMNPKRTVI
ncbi:type A2 lanthipeptide [Streptococcus pyogenes]|uniref:type A2 lanthipeptide n=1 Tax=Streptococcus pyogenes TaxID=1314 RepID=UPI001F60247F|nr:type A2 lanthipeptide [Streptococcus pyogenes]